MDPTSGRPRRAQTPPRWLVGLSAVVAGLGAWVAVLALARGDADPVTATGPQGSAVMGVGPGTGLLASTPSSPDGPGQLLDRALPGATPGGSTSGPTIDPVSTGSVLCGR